MHLSHRHGALMGILAALATLGLVVALPTMGAQAAVCTISNSATAPAEVKLTNSTAATARSASFGPPATSYVVVQVNIVFNRNVTTKPTLTVKDSLGAAFTAGPSAYDGGASGTYIFSRYYGSAPGAITVSVTRTNTIAAMFDVRTRVLTGAAASQVGAASTSRSSKSGRSLTKAITPTVVGSDIEVSTSIASNQTVAAAGGLITDSSWRDANDGSATAGGHKVTTDLTTRSLGWTVPSSTYWSLAALEVLPATTCTGGTTPPPPPPPPPGPLTWSPPACGAGGLVCTDLYLSNTGSNQAPQLASNVDYRIHLPTSGPLVGGLMIRGGHNVQIIGGQINMTVPCSDSSSACKGIYIAKSTAGQVYVEGVLIRNPTTIPPTCSTSGMPCSTGDGIGVDTQGTSTPTDVTLQNVRVEGISGCSGGSDHADILQPYQAHGSTFRIDRFTGTSNCQGIQIDPDLAQSDPPDYIIKNTNLKVINNPYSGNSNRYMWWLTGGSTGCISGNISLTNAYMQQPNGSLNAYAAWPETDTPTACHSVWSAPTLSFPNSGQITGTISAGLPPGGDFVTGAGTSYVSPGYQQ